MQNDLLENEGGFNNGCINVVGVRMGFATSYCT
jgi:hypothetical protein